MLSQLFVLLSGIGLVLSESEDSVVSSDESSDDSSSSSVSTDFLLSNMPVVVKSVLATTEYESAYYAVLYMLPDIVSQSLTSVDCGDSGKEYYSDNNFQFHQPYVPVHDSGDFPIAIVENAFDEKFNYFNNQLKKVSDTSKLRYDPFFDHSWALYKDDISSNIEVMQDQTDSGLDFDIIYFFMKWELNEQVDGKSQFISLIEYIPSTQVVIELISPYTSDYDEYLKDEYVFDSEPRMSFKGFDDLDKLPWDSVYNVIPIKQSRGVTNIDINVAYYVEYLGAEILLQGETHVNGRFVRYANVYLPYGDGFEVAFYERPSEDTYGGLSLDAYERGINSVHEHFLTSESCGFNQWFDNHYALLLMNYQTDFESIYNRISQSKQRYFLFVFSKDKADSFGRQGLETLGIDYMWFLYAVEPNGNTIEIVGYFENDDLAEVSTVWDGDFCPEVCTDKELFTKQWIDNGQYTSIARDMPKYASIFNDDRLSKDDGISRIKDFKPIPHISRDDQNDYDKHKKNKNSNTNIFIIGIFFSTLIGLLYAIYLKFYHKPNYKRNKSSETTPLIPHYGATMD